MDLNATPQDMLVFQAADRTNDNAILRPCVGAVADSREYHQKRRLGHFCRVKAHGQLFERLRPVFDQRCSAKLDFDQSIPSVT